MNKEELAEHIELLRVLKNYMTDCCDPTNSNDFVTYSNLIMNADYAIDQMSAHSITKDDARSEMISFAEWCGSTFIRLHDVWCHKFADQRDKQNWFITTELLERFRKEHNHSSGAGGSIAS